MFVVRRAEENPLLSPRKDHPWEASAVFNWCPVENGKTTHVVYRALSDKELLEEPRINRSIIARASSKDGVHFSEREPFIRPSEAFDKFGCEDPRITYINGAYYTFYTALSGYPFSADNIKIAVAISKDLKTVSEKHLVTPFNAKAMALFPEKINGKFAALLTVDTDRPPSDIAYAEFSKMSDLWNEDYWKVWYENKATHTINFRRGNDDQVELGAPPLKTKKGWLVIYSHINHYQSDNRTFGIEAVLLDLKDPRIILGRTKGSFMTPEAFYEQVGMVPNIVFPSGALIKGDRLDIYYGAADTFCAKASIRLSDLLRSMTPGKQELVERYSKNPILEPRKKKDWEAHGIFNPAAVDLNKKVHILYRAMGDDDTATVGLAVSNNGYSVDEWLPKPIYTPREDFENKHHPGNSGCEDPRIVEMEGSLYMTYTAYDGFTPRVAISSISKSDFLNRKWNKWSKPQVITPPGIANKDACLVPEKTKQGYVLLHRVSESICADVVQSLDFTTEKVSKCIEILEPRRGMWDGTKVGGSTTPIKTKHGWLFLYHGVSETRTYRVGALLLDLKDPTRVLSRTAMPIFEPKENYELEGIVPKVVFPCGNIKRGDKLFIYYGGGDKVVGVATLKMSELLKILTWKP